MGLFDKKICDVCGNKIGLMGNRKFTVASGSNPLTSNPDILDFSQAVSCELTVDESQHEKRENVVKHPFKAKGCFIMLRFNI